MATTSVAIFCQMPWASSDLPCTANTPISTLIPMPSAMLTFQFVGNTSSFPLVMFQNPASGGFTRRYQGNPLRPPTLNTASQVPWVQLFQALRANQAHRNEQLAPLTAPPQTRTEMTVIGGNYDFVIPQPWPTGVVYIDRSVFSASRPFPVLPPQEYIDEDCGCEVCCVSSAGSNLTSACVNINTATLCDETNCSLGPACGNRFIPRFPLELVESRVGLGVVSTHRIPEGAFIIEYVGEILYGDDADERDDHSYQAQFRSQAEWGGGSTVVVDALRCGNESRFINHSCQPNAVMYEYDWTNTTRLGIFANREIPALQELTFKYCRRGRQSFECQCPAHLVVP